MKIIPNRSVRLQYGIVWSVRYQFIFHSKDNFGSSFFVTFTTFSKRSVPLRFLSALCIKFGREPKFVLRHTCRCHTYRYLP